jgi:hypothetical protein
MHRQKVECLFTRRIHRIKVQEFFHGMKIKKLVLKQSVFHPELIQWEYNMVRFQVGSLIRNRTTMPPSAHQCIKRYWQNNKEAAIHKIDNTYWCHPISHLQFSVLLSSTTFCYSRNVDSLEGETIQWLSHYDSWHNKNKKQSTIKLVLYYTITDCYIIQNFKCSEPCLL